MGWTNIHVQRMFETWFEGSGAPTNFYLTFATSATTPTIDTSSTSQLTLVPSGNTGWPGSATISRTGLMIAASAYGGPTNTDDYVQVSLSSLTLSGSGGDIPHTGDPLRWLLLCGTPGGNGITELYNYWSLGGNTTVANGQSFLISNGALRGSGA